MKKLSSVQLKQQAIVGDICDTIESEGRAALAGFVQCWFSVEYHQFPGSLLLRFQFESEDALQSAEPELKNWQRRLSAKLLKKGVVLKDMRRHLLFTVAGPDD